MIPSNCGYSQSVDNSVALLNQESNEAEKIATKYNITIEKATQVLEESNDLWRKIMIFVAPIFLTLLVGVASLVLNNLFSSWVFVALWAVHVYRKEKPEEGVIDYLGDLWEDCSDGANSMLEKMKECSKQLIVHVVALRHEEANKRIIRA